MNQQKGTFLPWIPEEAFAFRTDYCGEWKESGLTGLQKSKDKKSSVKVLWDVTENMRCSPVSWSC